MGGAGWRVGKGVGPRVGGGYQAGRGGCTRPNWEDLFRSQSDLLGNSSSALERIKSYEPQDL